MSDQRALVNITLILLNRYQSYLLLRQLQDFCNNFNIFILQIYVSLIIKIIQKIINYLI